MKTTAGAVPTLDVSLAPKARPRRELVMRAYQPLASLLVRALARTGVHPHTVVVAHGAVALAAAAAVAAGATVAAGPVVAGAAPLALVLAAVALQVRAVLDNVDGGLARATGRVTATGRYLDTAVDMAGNALLLAAVALHGPGPIAWPLAAAALVVLSMVLSLDFNLERRYKSVRGQGEGAEAPPAGVRDTAHGALRWVYERVLAPQDRLAAALDDALFALASSSQPGLRRAGQRRRADGPELEHALAWSDLFSTASLVNLGQSTQMLALGVCLALGAPFAYVLLVLAQGVYVVVVQLVRVARFRRYLRAP